MAYPLQEDKKGGWDYKVVESLAGGINLAVGSDKIEDSQCLEAKNVIVSKGRLQIDSGYKEFGSTVLGTPQATYQYFKNNGAQELLLITTATLYKFNTGNEQWQFVSDGVKTTTTSAHAAGATTINLTSSSGFNPGAYAGVMLSDGTEHHSLIQSVPSATSILLATAIPAGKSVVSGAEVVQAVFLDGSLDEQVSAETMPSHEWFVFSNGVDRIKRYNGIDCVNLPGLGNVRARWLRLYNNCLFLINTTEGGTSFPRRIRRSDAGNPTEWRIGVGVAGYDELLDAEDPLQSAEILGPYLIVYAEREIYRGEFVGTGGVNYKFDPMIRGEGLIGSAVVADVGDYHIIMAQSNIYEYRGGFELVPVGDPVYYRLFGSQGILSPANKHKSFCFYVEELDEVWFFWPSTSSQEGCDRLTRYNVGEKTFTERVFPNEFVGFGYFETRSSRPWSSLVGSWLNQTWKWNERTLLSASPTTHLCSTVNQVMEYDYIQTLDNDATIPYIVESKDFVVPDQNHRFDMLEMYLQGNGVVVEASIDEGVSWINLGTVNHTNMRRARLFQQFLFDRIRFRWSGVGGSFKLGWFGFSHRAESVY